MLVWTRSIVVGLVAVVSTSVAADDNLIGHWRLSGDAQDATAHKRHALATSVDFQAKGPPGATAGAASFDGVRSELIVPADRAPQLGSRDFSILVRIHTDNSLDDLPGEIISQYDPQTRTGFRIGLDSRPGVTSSQSNWRNLHFGMDAGEPVGRWTDHGRLGDAVLIYSMAVYDGQLFAGTCEAGVKQAGRVFRFDGRSWTDCGAPDHCNAVSALAVHRGRLYAGVSKYRLAGSALAESDNPNLGGKVYRYAGDKRWELCGELPGVEAINGMVVYRGKLYASSMYAPAAFFRYDGGNRWTPCQTPAGKRVESLTVFNGFIYATGYDEGAVYRFDGESWKHLGVLPEANQTYGFAAYRGELHVSEWPHARVYRYEGGQAWRPAGRLGDEKESMPLVVYNGKMYGGTLPLGSVFRFDNGADQKWTHVGRLDLTPDVRYRRVWSMAVFRGRLFAGTLPSGRVHSIEIGRNVTHDRALPPGWRHVAAVREENSLKLYVDGELVGRSSAFAARQFNLNSRQPLRIGSGSTDHFLGRLADLRVYGRALTAAQIKRLAASP
ncbi:MAG: hypothetical protein QGG36_14260 [Pirellulaceae bacterium]|nr:hypothetical protein [Pirellulaceae bacterium]